VDLAAVFLLSLLGGYFFAYSWKLTAYATRRAEGHHLYFRAALFGVFLFGAALLLRQLLLARSSAYKAFDAWLVEYVKPALKEETGVPAAEMLSRAQWVVAAMYSLLIGPLAAAVLNLFTPRLWALERSVGALDQLLLKAQRAEMPVSLTLTTGKVYIGAVVSIADPKGTPSVVMIVPVFSGYRDAHGRMFLTTDYARVYADLDEGGAAQLALPADWQADFQLAIRADHIATATLFSPAVYTRFTPEWQEQLLRPPKPAPQELVVEIKPRADHATGSGQ
jgi:hypothetical protein